MKKREVSKISSTYNLIFLGRPAKWIVMNPVCHCCDRPAVLAVYKRYQSEGGLPVEPSCDHPTRVTFENFVSIF